MPAFTLALALDVTAMQWERHKQVTPWVLLSAGRMMYPFRGITKPPEFWRAVWFSRYAESLDEVRYYDHWLAQLEAATNAEIGTRGKSALWQQAEQKLASAEQRILGRDQPPTFLYNWLKSWLKEA